MISGIFGAVLALLILIVYPIVSQKSVTQLEQIKDRDSSGFSPSTAHLPIIRVLTRPVASSISLGFCSLNPSVSRRSLLRFPILPTFTPNSCLVAVTLLPPDYQ